MTDAPIILVCGHASDEALAFLAENGALIEVYRGLYIVQLPENVRIVREGKREGPRRHHIVFLDEQGESMDESLCLVVWLKINALSSRIDIVFDYTQKGEQESV